MSHKKKLVSNRRPVVWLNCNMTFPNVAEAARYAGIPYMVLYDMLNHKRPFKKGKYAGLRFKYANER